MQYALNKWDMVFPPASRYTICGDGNCQFRALSWACYGTENRHNEVRQNVCEYMRCNVKNFSDMITSPTYIDQMANDGVFGDHLTLQAFADAYHSNIMILDNHECITLVKASRSTSDTPYLTILYENNNHYNGVQPHHAYPTNILLADIQANINFTNQASFA